MGVGKGPIPPQRAFWPTGDPLDSTTPEGRAASGGAVDLNPGFATKSYLFRHAHASGFNFEHVVAVCLLFYEAMLEVAPKSGPESK